MPRCIKISSARLNIIFYATLNDFLRQSPRPKFLGIGFQKWRNVGHSAIKRGIFSKQLLLKARTLSFVPPRSEASFENEPASVQRGRVQSGGAELFRLENARIQNHV